MRKPLLYLVFQLLFIIVAKAQAPLHCGTNDILNQARSNPAFIQKEKELNERIRQAVLENVNLPYYGKNAAQTYTIPVVVHVIHAAGTPVGTAENISDAQIQRAIGYINMGYGNTDSLYFSKNIPLGIQLCLAVRDTSNKLTTGITRHASKFTNVNNEVNDDSLKKSISWDPTKYMNIWIVKEICNNTNCGTSGYSTMANSHGDPKDGIVCEAKYFGTKPKLITTMLHEIGHYFNLYHTFESCKNNDCMLDGDMVCDTPPDNSTTSAACSTTVNTCNTDENDTTSKNPFRPVALGGLGDQPDMIQNYMDYNFESCLDRFTPGQRDRMIACLTTIRSSLLKSDGCISPNTAPISRFSSGICAGTIAFKDESINSPTSWNWTFDKGTPTTSILKNPAVTFSSPGKYLVTLTASNGLGAGTTETKEITVYAAAAAASCSPTTGPNASKYTMGIRNVSVGTLNHSTNGAFADGGYLNLSCNQVVVLSPETTYPVSVTTSASFKEFVKIYIDYDNNGTFENSELAYNDTARLGRHTGKIISPKGTVTNTLLRMRVMSDYNAIASGCSNLTYGQAEDYGVVLASEVLTGIEEKELTRADIQPNPFTGSAWVVPSNYSGSLTFTVFDYLGKTIYTENRSNAEPFEYVGSELNNGIYFYKIDTKDRKAVIGKFVKM